MLPSIDAGISAIYLALREEAAPSGLRIYDAAETAHHFDGHVLPAGHVLLCAGTAGPTDLAGTGAGSPSWAVHRTASGSPTFRASASAAVDHHDRVSVDRMAGKDPIDEQLWIPA